MSGDTTHGDPAFPALTQQMMTQLRLGRHLVLWGPRGGGKTTLLQAVERELGDGHHALSVATHHLDDITRALERAYPTVSTKVVKPCGAIASVVGGRCGTRLFAARSRDEGSCGDEGLATSVARRCDGGPARRRCRFAPGTGVASRTEDRMLERSHANR
jgi:ABC-type hemin transport system ATPase subunit